MSFLTQETNISEKWSLEKLHNSKTHLSFPIIHAMHGDTILFSNPLCAEPAFNMYNPKKKMKIRSIAPVIHKCDDYI